MGAAEAIASSPVDKSDPLKSEANNAAAIPRSDDVHEGGGDDGIVTEDYNYLKSAEELKREADHLEELHRKIAAEPVPPNSKAAAEAIASSPASQEQSDPAKAAADAAASVPQSDNV